MDSKGKREAFVGSIMKGKLKKKKKGRPRKRKRKRNYRTKKALEER